MDKKQMVALGVAGAMIYVSVTGKVKGPMKTGLLAVGSIAALKNAPIVSGIVGQYV